MTIRSNVWIKGGTTEVKEIGGFIKDMFTVYNPQRSLQSVSNLLPNVPFTRNGFFKYYPRVAGPIANNGIPNHVNNLCTYILQNANPEVS
mgnify:CR=1 FL=1